MKQQSARTRAISSPFRLTAVALSGALIGAAVTSQFDFDAHAANALSSSNDVVTSGSIGPAAGFADIVERVKPAVVNISISGKVESNAMSAPDQIPPEYQEFMRRFFPHGAPTMPDRMRPAQTLGSGFIIDASGLIVTNSHVVDGASEIDVVLGDGTRLPAELKGVDEKTDLAVLKVNHDEALPFVEFGDSDVSRVGDWVIAIGNPFGLGGTTTTGIISARGRDISSGPYDDYIQIDASINRGNSGGPLFNLQGEVIGVNTAIFSPNGGNIGIGFAIPASLATNVIEQLASTGTVQRGWLGVHIQEVSEDIADSLGLEDAQGALVVEILEGSPAAQSGLEVGDIILEYNDNPLEKMRDLPRLVAETRAGAPALLKVWRDGETITLDSEIGTQSEENQVAQADHATPSDTPKLGLVLSSLDEETRAKYNVDDTTEGVLVTRVLPDSPAARKGLQSGDVILAVGKDTVTTPQDIVAHVRSAHDADKSTVLLRVERRGQERFVAVRFS